MDLLIRPRDPIIRLCAATCWVLPRLRVPGEAGRERWRAVEGKAWEKGRVHANRQTTVAAHCASARCAPVQQCRVLVAGFCVAGPGPGGTGRAGPGRLVAVCHGRTKRAGGGAAGQANKEQRRIGRRIRRRGRWARWLESLRHLGALPM